MNIPAIIADLEEQYPESAVHSFFENQVFEYVSDEDLEDDEYEEDLAEFNDAHTWQYNLEQVVRFGTEDAKEDVAFYVCHWLEKIAIQEGYTLVKTC